MDNVDKKEQYDSIADTFVSAKREFFETEADFGREYILNHLKDADGTLLDIGCGTGEDMAIYEKMSFVKVLGIDPSAQMIEKARLVVAHPENLCIAGYENIPFADQSIDCVVARFSLHYMQNLDSAYKEMSRVLKQNGKLIQVVDHPLADAVEGEHFIKDDVPHVRIKLYRGKVIIEFPIHNFSDYFSPFFFEHFELLEVVEHTAKDREFQVGPNVLAYVAQKRPV